MESTKSYFSLKWLSVTLLSGLLYYCSARLGYFLTFQHTVILPLWPPAGIGLALMHIYGRKYVWPGIVIASVLISSIASWNKPELDLWIRGTIMFFLASGRALEACVGHWLIKKYIGDDLFSSPKHTFKFLYIVLGISVIGSFMLLVCLYFFDVLPLDSLEILMFDYWIGNVVGIFLFTPLILILFNYKINRVSRENVNDFLGFILLFLSVLLLLKIDLIRYPLIQSLPFIIVPYLLWMAFRYDLVVSFSGVFITAFVGLYFTVIAQKGPFIVEHSGEHSMLYIQVFIAVICFSSLLLSASMRERNAAQEDIRKLNEQLEQRVAERTAELTKRNKELDRLVYSVSHDLRAPVTSIMGLINLAKVDTNEVSRENYFQLMQQSAIKQDHFIREILDHSKNSRVNVQRDQIYFAALIEDIFEELQFSAEAINKTISSNQVAPFYCDRWRVRIILSNIISNAIRYRKDPGVSIAFQIKIVDKHAFLEIKDDGKGIGKEHLDNVFQMFYRATDEGAGSGLGLYIVKEAIEKLNGVIRIESELGVGTTLKLEIPEVTEKVSRAEV